jgi:hypothetical protein
MVNETMPKQLLVIEQTRRQIAVLRAGLEAAILAAPAASPLPVLRLRCDQTSAAQAVAAPTQASLLNQVIPNCPDHVDCASL